MSGTFAALLADTFYVHMFQKDLYALGSALDILWIWEYIFLIFAIYSNSQFLDFIKNKSKIVKHRNNLIAPLLIVTAFLVIFTSLVVSSLIFEQSLENDSEGELTELIYYQTLIIFIIGTGIAIFAMKVKKIKYQFVIGLSIISLILVFQIYFDDVIGNELGEISEYHHLMGSPAIYYLDQTHINFENWT